MSVEKARYVSKLFAHSLVFDFVVICKILYASLAWFGYVNNDHVNLIHKLLSKASSKVKPFVGVYLANDTTHETCYLTVIYFCSKLHRPYHCLYHLLPPERHVGI